MSAGGLTYSMLTNSRKVTLPSVEMWNTNMNILKDPNKGIFTRRIDKVGSTQEILREQGDSGDRICEYINVYARGVNPMVGVSYDNYGTNGGTRSSITQRPQAVKLPYRVENVRPPVLRQEDLLPLSRLPRNWFYTYTNPQFPDFVQQMQCNETKSSVIPSHKVLHAETRRTPILVDGIDHIKNTEISDTHPSLVDSAKMDGRKATQISSCKTFDKDTFHNEIQSLDKKHFDDRHVLTSAFSSKTSSLVEHPSEPSNYSIQNDPLKASCDTSYARSIQGTGRVSLDRNFASSEYIQKNIPHGSVHTNIRQSFETCTPIEPTAKFIVPEPLRKEWRSHAIRAGDVHLENTTDIPSAQHPFLYTQVHTQPLQSHRQSIQFDNIHVDSAHVHSSILHPVSETNRVQPHLQSILENPGTISSHAPQHVRPLIHQYQTPISSFVKEQTLDPDYSSQSVIVQQPLSMSASAATQHISRGDDVVRQELSSINRVLTKNLPSHTSRTNEIGPQKQEYLTDSVLHKTKEIPHITHETFQDRSHECKMYQEGHQSTAVHDKILPTAFHGSFQQIGSHVPQLHHMSNQATNMPIQQNDINKKAYKAFHERYQS